MSQPDEPTNVDSVLATPARATLTNSAPPTTDKKGTPKCSREEANSIRNILKDYGWTAQAIANKTGIPVSTLKSFLSGNGRCSQDNYTKLIEFIQNNERIVTKKIEKRLFFELDIDEPSAEDPKEETEAPDDSDEPNTNVPKQDTESQVLEDVSQERISFSTFPAAKYIELFGPMDNRPWLHLKLKELTQDGSSQLPYLLAGYKSLVIVSTKEVTVEDEIMLVLLSIQSEIPPLIKLQRQLELSFKYSNGPVEFVFTHCQSPHYIVLIIETKKAEFSSSLENHECQIMMQMRAAQDMNSSLPNGSTIPVYGILTSFDRYIIFKLHNGSFSSADFHIDASNQTSGYFDLARSLNWILAKQEKEIVAAMRKRQTKEK